MDDESLIAYARHCDEYFNEKLDSFRPETADVSTDLLDSILLDMVLLYSDFSKGA